MKIITNQIVLLTLFLFSSFISISQDIEWESYETEVEVSIGDLDSHTLNATSPCEGDVVVTWVDETYSGGCYGHIYRTYSAVDDCGFISTSFQIITITNTSIIVETPIQVECSGSIPEAEYTFVSDINEGLTVDITEIDEGTGCDRTITRTYVVTDACGYVGNPVIQVINVIDTTPPQIHNVIVSSFAFCDAIPDPNDITTSDNCNNSVDLTYVENVGGTSCSPIIYRTWTAVDACGNETTITQTIVIIYDPYFAQDFNEEMTIECHQVTNPPELTVLGVCTDDQEIVLTEEIVAEGCGQMITRTWTWMDDCGNDLEATQIIHLIDTTAPLISVPMDETINCDTEIPGVGNVDVSDYCNDDLEVDFSETTTNAEQCPYEIIRTWTVSDNCGNTTSASQIITVVEGPVAYSNQPIEITSIIPNPISIQSKIQFVSQVETYAIMDVYDMKGRRMATVFNGELNAKQTQEVDVVVENRE